jgi:hypothetical protein
MGFSEEEKVKILLNEYNTLRAEIIARVGHSYQLIAVGVAAILLLFGLWPIGKIFWAMLAIAVTTIAIAFWIWLRDTLKAAERIREIEIDINQRVGEDILIWENIWGGGVTGFIGRARPLSRIHLSTRVAPIRTWHGKALTVEASDPRSAEGH